MNEFLLFLSVVLCSFGALYVLNRMILAYIAAKAGWLMAAFTAAPSSATLAAAEDFLKTWRPERARIELVIWRRYQSMRQAFERREILLSSGKESESE